MVSLSKYHLLAMVVPGPSKPKCWDAYHKALGQQLEGSVLVTSMQYSRHKSRNASRVLVAFETSPGNQQYYAAEVDYYVQLRQPAAGGSSASSSATAVLSWLCCAASSVGTSHTPTWQSCF